MGAPSRDQVLAAIVEGIDALESIAAGYGDDQWGLRTPCDEWDATALAGHVRCVSRWYHAWLDRAEDGEITKPFDSSELPEQNRLALAELDAEGPLDGPARVAAFAQSARAYAGRLPDAWDLPFGYPRGTVTAGLHAGMVTVEWHVHAWDLARTVGLDHRPAHPEVLVQAAATTQASLQVDRGRGRGLAAAVGRSVAARRARREGDPWLFLLGVAGRVEPDGDKPAI